MTSFDDGLGNLLSDVPSATMDLLLLYGPPGQGKTHLGLTASEVEGMYPVLVIDTENSTTGVLDKFDRSRIDVLRPREVFDDEDVYPNTLSILKRIASGESEKYKTIIIDTADVLFQWGLDWHKAQAGNSGFDIYTNIHSDLTAAPGMGNVGLFQRLKESGVTTILTVHEKSTANDAGEAFSEFQWSGQGKGILGGIPDAILYVTRTTKSSGESTSTVLSQPTKRNHAKNRFGFPFKMTNPTMQTLADLAKGNVVSNEKDAK